MTEASASRVSFLHAGVYVCKRTPQNGAGAVVKRRVDDGIVKGAGERDAVVANQSNVAAEAEAVISFNPRKVVHEIMHRRHATQPTPVAQRSEDEAERDAVFVDSPLSVKAARVKP